MENKFPILGSEPKEYIPLDIIKPHEKQALRNHGQTLKRLAERGGLGWIEALCVLEDREYDFHTKLTEEIARIKVLEIVRYEKSHNLELCIDNYDFTTTELIRIYNMLMNYSDSCENLDLKSKITKMINKRIEE